MELYNLRLPMLLIPFPLPSPPPQKKNKPHTTIDEHISMFNLGTKSSRNKQQMSFLGVPVQLGKLSQKFLPKFT